MTGKRPVSFRNLNSSVTTSNSRKRQRVIVFTELLAFSLLSLLLLPDLLLGVGMAHKCCQEQIILVANTAFVVSIRQWQLLGTSSLQMLCFVWQTARVLPWIRLSAESGKCNHMETTPKRIVTATCVRQETNANLVSRRIYRCQCGLHQECFHLLLVHRPPLSGYTGYAL